MSTLSVLKRWLETISVGAIAGAVLALVVTAGECNAFRGQARREAVPAPAPPTKIENRAEAVTLPCETVQALEPRPQDRERIAERYARPDLAEAPVQKRTGSSVPGAITRILAERELPALPAGGTALVTLEPGGRVEVTVAPEPEHVWDWHSTWELGALYGVDLERAARGRAWAAVEPLRFGRVHLRAEAGVDLRSGSTDAYAMAGAVWRSR